MTKKDSYNLMVWIIFAVTTLIAAVIGTVSYFQTLDTVPLPPAVSLPIFAAGLGIMILFSAVFISCVKGWKFKFWWKGLFFSLVIAPTVLAFCVGVFIFVLGIFGIDTDFATDSSHVIMFYLFVAMLIFAAKTGEDAEKEILKPEISKKSK